MEYDGQAAAGPALSRADLAPEDATPDRDEAAFESGRTRREGRREDRRFQSLLRDRSTDRQRIQELEARLATADRERAKGRLQEVDDELSSTEKSLRDALADGDADEAAKANRRLASLAADRKAVELQDQEAERVASAAARQPKLAPEAQEWIERNKGWFQQDERATKLAMLAHNEAVEVEGLTPNSPEYFEHIEERVRAKFPKLIAAAEGDDPDDDELEDDEPEPARQPRAAPANRGAAPVTRSAPTPPPRTGRQVRATAQQVEFAKIAGISIQEYMASQASLSRAGRNGNR